jgi:shikimate kinase
VTDGGPKAVLVGLPGSGKTSVGRRLAALLVVPFADSDDLVEQYAGRCVREIFATDGEDGFRALEARVIAAALTSFSGVLSLGGGAVLVESTRAALRDAGVPVVHLTTRVVTLTGRIGDGRSRPLLTGDPASRLAVLAEAREPWYREVATVVVDTERRSIRRVAEVIADQLGVAVPQQ